MAPSKTLSIGIPTYEAHKSIIKTLQSIYKQTLFNKVDSVILMVDGNSIRKEILKEIKNPKLKIIYKTERKGQSTRINDIFSSVNSDYLLLTNDDILLKEKSLENIFTVISQRNDDLLACQVEPIRPNNFFQKIIKVGFSINKLLSKSWKQGDNYLTCNGRGVVLSKKLYKNIIIPAKLWNNDAYMYLFTKINKYRYSVINNTFVYYKLPAGIDEHMKQSSKFAFSLSENSTYLKKIEKYYQVPTIETFKAILISFITNPFYTTLYLGLLTYIRMRALNMKNNSSYGFWNTDISTKSI